MRGALLFFAAVALVAARVAGAQTTAVSPPMPALLLQASPPQTAPAVRCCLIVAGTPVEIELTELVSSKYVKSGDRFPIRLARDLEFQGALVLPAGAQGFGEVVDAAPGGLAGRPGKLVLAARSLATGGKALPLRSFKLAASGRDNSKVAVTAYVAVGIAAVVIQGGNVDYPAGTRVIAKVAADTMIEVPDQRSPAPAPNVPTPTDKENPQ